MNSKPIGSNDIEMYKAKATLEQYTRTKKLESWSYKTECLLKEWAEKAAGYRWLHLRSSELYTKYNNYLAYPIIIFSCIVGIGGLSSISGERPTEVELITQYVFFTCNIIVSMFSSIQRFNNFIEYSEKHTQAAIQYSKFYRLINMELSLERCDREYGIDFCKFSKTEFDRLLSTSPEVPLQIINIFNIEHKDVLNKPDVANGLTHLDCNIYIDNDKDFSESSKPLSIDNDEINI
jgi:hypothetical protein